MRLKNSDELYSKLRIQIEKIKKNVLNNPEIKKKNLTKQELDKITQILLAELFALDLPNIDAFIREYIRRVKEKVGIQKAEITKAQPEVRQLPNSEKNYVKKDKLLDYLMSIGYKYTAEELESIMKNIIEILTNINYNFTPYASEKLLENYKKLYYFVFYYMKNIKKEHPKVSIGKLIDVIGDFRIVSLCRAFEELRIINIYPLGRQLKDEENEYHKPIEEKVEIKALEEPVVVLRSQPTDILVEPKTLNRAPKSIHNLHLYTLKSNLVLHMYYPDYVQRKGREFYKYNPQTLKVDLDYIKKKRDKLDLVIEELEQRNFPFSAKSCIKLLEKSDRLNDIIGFYLDEIQNLTAFLAKINNPKKYLLLKVYIILNNPQAKKVTDPTKSNSKDSDIIFTSYNLPKNIFDFLEKSSKQVKKAAQSILNSSQLDLFNRTYSKITGQLSMYGLKDLKEKGIITQEIIPLLQNYFKIKKSNKGLNSRKNNQSSHNLKLLYSKYSSCLEGFTENIFSVALEFNFPCFLETKDKELIPQIIEWLKSNKQGLLSCDIVTSSPNMALKYHDLEQKYPLSLAEKKSLFNAPLEDIELMEMIIADIESSMEETYQRKCC